MIGKSKEQKAKSRNTIRTGLVLGLIAVIIIWGCGRREADDRQVITVSILPQKFFVERIAGERFHIQVMIPPGADSHTYEPAPKDIQNLSASSLYFSMGHIDFERSWMDKFRAVNPHMRVAGLPDDIETITGDPGHEGIDPHLWLSTLEVRKIVRMMLQQIIALDTENKAVYEDNYRQFMLEMDTLELYLSQLLSPGKGKPVIIYHPSLAYLARDYGFVQVSIEEEGKQPSVFHMKGIIELARKENISTILIQKQIDMDMAGGIAGEIGGQVVAIDPLAYQWTENMKEIARILNTIFQSH